MSTATDAMPGADRAVAAALAVENLEIAYRVRGRPQRVVRDVSFRVGRGESYGLVGESGCGKSTIALAIVRYLARNGRVAGGAVSIDGRDVLAMNANQLRQLRASTVSMVYQEPGRALNPTLRVGRQVAEVFEIGGVARSQALERSEEMLSRVRIADPGDVMRRFPHQLSGGMLQRVVIAMALAAQPSLLILDEPTTALDATVEAEVLDLIAALREEFHTSLLFISHNLGVIARMCDRVGVLYAGEMVEQGPARAVFNDPRHPYTVGLLRCIPRRDTLKAHRALDTIPGFLPAPGQITAGCIFADRCGLAEARCREETPPLYEAEPGRQARCHFHERAQTLPRATAAGTEAAPERSLQPLIQASNVSKTFRSTGETVHGLVGVDLELRAGETLGLVGESGSGKTTLARVLLGLSEPDSGATIRLGDQELAGLATRRTHEQQKALQIVFQNPDSALNRRHSVRRLISRALAQLGGYHGHALVERLSKLISEVRLSERHLAMRPVQLSGGLKQRVAIARAFAGDPRIVVCDEPTSALDVSVQAAILNLLTDLQRREQVTYLFISHDLGVVRYLSDRIAVLYLGRIMEIGPAERVFSGPHHPYTEALLSAVPTLEDTDRERIRLEGEIPSAAHPPSGCVFHTRCPRYLGSICEETEPELQESEPGHAIRCHIPLEELEQMQGRDEAPAPPPARLP
ncbi:MAG TPA: dipeptide ABC transporter ATP-binding protein [Solirubrobacteraceae bacterium]|nr:dipeptide ABC transporter ATP-binding protein [Solirubrobacteraceae bacterium]